MYNDTDRSEFWALLFLAFFSFMVGGLTAWVVSSSTSSPPKPDPYAQCELVEAHQTTLLAEVGYRLRGEVPDGATIFLLSEKRYCWSNR